MNKNIRVIFLALGVIALGAGLLAAQNSPSPFHRPQKGKTVRLTDSLVIKTNLGYHAAFLDLFYSPEGIGVSTRGDTVYLTDDGDSIFRDRNHTIKGFPTPGTGLLAARLRGAIYAGDGIGQIWKIDEESVTPRGHDLYGDVVTALDADPATGTVYFITQYSSGLWNYLYKLPPGATTATLITSWPDIPSWGLALKGNWLYISSYYGDAISRINKNGGSFEPAVAGLDGPTDICFDKQGNLFVAEYKGGSIARVKAGTGSIARIALGFVDPFYLQLDAQGDIFLTDPGSGEIWKLWK